MLESVVKCWPIWMYLELYKRLCLKVIHWDRFFLLSCLVVHIILYYIIYILLYMIEIIKMKSHHEIILTVVIITVCAVSKLSSVIHQ